MNKRYLLLVLLTFIFSAQSCSIKHNLRKHVKYLASDELNGRYPTTKGDTLATQYITEFLHKNDISYQLQPFDYLSRIFTAGNVNLHLDDSTRNLKYGEDFIISKNSSDGVLNSEVVFIGYGIPKKNNSVFKKIVRDKSVIVFLCPYRGCPRKTMTHWRETFMSKVELYNYLIKNGAKSILTITPGDDDRGLKDVNQKKMIGKSNKKYLIPIIQINESVFEEILRSKNIPINDFKYQMYHSRVPISNDFTDVSIDIDIKVEFQNKKTNNIIALVKGIDTTAAIVVGAHYDHLLPGRYRSEEDSIRNGADDNASGTAMVMELSQWFQQSEVNPECNILFTLFSAEENHCSGSQYFVNNYTNDFGKIKAMINFDMIGRLEDTLYVNQYYSSPIWANIFKEASIPEYTYKFLSHEKSCGYSDESSFIDKNIPALYFTTGMHDDLHRPGDEYDKINFSGMNEIFDSACEIIEATCKQDY